MANIRHPSFSQPHDPNSKVWRYIDLPKLIWILERRKLYFVRADLLNDPHEGSVTKKSKELFISFWKNTLKDAHIELAKFHLKAKSCTYLSCWHKNNSESEAMWKIYCKNDQGIAIQSRYSRLVESLIDEHVFIGEVQYLDYETESFPIGNLFTPFMYKRKAFEHEKEIRAIAQSPEGFEKKPRKPELGLEIDWDIEKAIESIFVNPYSEPWYYDVVVSVVKKYYPPLLDNIKWSVMKSQPQY